MGLFGEWVSNKRKTTIPHIVHVPPPPQQKNTPYPLNNNKNTKTLNHYRTNTL